MSGRRRCGGLADRAEHSSACDRPASLGSVIHVDLVVLLVHKDQITGLAAVALRLLVHAPDVGDCSACTDLIAVNSCIGGNGTIGLHIVHLVVYDKPAFGTALFSIISAEIVQLLIDGDKTACAGAALLRVEVIVVITDLSVAGQDLALDRKSVV